MSDFFLGMVGASLIEQCAVALGLINVSLIIRRSVWNFPFGLLMVLLYAKIFYDYRLYSDALLQIYFFAIQIYGWWYWLKGRDHSGLVVVVRLPLVHWPLYALLALAGVALLGTVMDSLTDADYAYWDATIAILSVVAQFLMSRRILESWLIWITVDVLAVGLFAAKGLNPTAALYALFLVLASVGFVAWLRAYNKGVPVN